jgi:hypothetical protein
MGISAFFHAIVYGLRAHARGFGKPAITAVPRSSEPTSTSTSSTSTSKNRRKERETFSLFESGSTELTSAELTDSSSSELPMAQRSRTPFNPSSNFDAKRLVPRQDFNEVVFGVGNQIKPMPFPTNNTSINEEPENGLTRSGQYPAAAYQSSGFFSRGLPPHQGFNEEPENHLTRAGQYPAAPYKSPGFFSRGLPPHKGVNEIDFDSSNKIKPMPFPVNNTQNEEPENRLTRSGQFAMDPAVQQAFQRFSSNDEAGGVMPYLAPGFQ